MTTQAPAPQQDVLPEEKQLRRETERPELRLPTLNAHTRLHNRRLLEEYVKIAEQHKAAEAMIEAHDDKGRFDELQDRFLDLLVLRAQEARGDIPREHTMPVDITTEEFEKVIKESSPLAVLDEGKPEGSAIKREFSDIILDSFGARGLSGFFNPETVSADDAKEVAAEIKEYGEDAAEFAYRKMQAINKGLGYIPSRALDSFNQTAGMTFKFKHVPDAEERLEIAEAQKRHAEYKLEELLNKLKYRGNSSLDDVLGSRPQQEKILQEDMELLATAMACREIQEDDMHPDDYETYSLIQRYANTMDEKDFERLGYSLAKGRDTVNEGSLLYRLGVEHDPSLDRTWLSSGSLLGFNEIRAVVDCLKTQKLSGELQTRLTSGLAYAETPEERREIYAEVESQVQQLRRELTTSVANSIYGGTVFGHDYAPRLDSREQVAAFHLIAELKRRENPLCPTSDLISTTASQISTITDGPLGGRFEDETKERITSFWTEDGLYEKAARKMSDAELYAAWEELSTRNPLLEQEAGALYTSIANSIEAYKPLFSAVQDTSIALARNRETAKEEVVSAEVVGEQIQYRGSPRFDALIGPLSHLRTQTENVLSSHLGTNSSSIPEKLKQFEATNQQTPAQAVAAAEFVERVYRRFFPSSQTP